MCAEVISTRRSCKVPVRLVLPCLCVLQHIRREINPCRLACNAGVYGRPAQLSKTFFTMTQHGTRVAFVTFRGVPSLGVKGVRTAACYVSFNVGIYRRSLGNRRVKPGLQ